MKKERKSKNFIEKPVYEGGPSAMSKFVDQNLNYPKEAQDAGVSGTVVIRYKIDYKGQVIETKVLSSIGHGCDEEAERVVSLLQFKMGSYRNMKIHFHKTIKVHFRVKKAAVHPSPKSVNYNYVPTKKSSAQTKTSTSKSSYSYNITIGNNKEN